MKIRRELPRFRGGAASFVVAILLATWGKQGFTAASGTYQTRITAVVVPPLLRNTDNQRTLVVFNETFSGTTITVAWEVHADSPTGAVASSGLVPLDVPLGGHVSQAVTIHTPSAGTKAFLVLRATKNGAVSFEETAESFALN